MMRLLFAASLVVLSVLGACDVPVKSQTLSHVAEFNMKTGDSPALLAELDSTGRLFA